MQVEKDTALAPMPDYRKQCSKIVSFPLFHSYFLSDLSMIPQPVYPNPFTHLIPTSRISFSCEKDTGENGILSDSWQ